MKNTLIVIATLAVIASGAAGADSFTLRIVDRGDRPHAGTTDFRYEDRSFGHGDRRYRPGIDERQTRLNALLQRGVSSGALTRWEARRIHRELASIEARERAFEADGRLDRRERAELDRELDRVAWNLRSQLTDHERRY